MPVKRGTNFSAIASFPAWAGVHFVPKRHHDVPAALAPMRQLLPQPFVVIITGASRGIGRESAKAFARAGATGLVLTARSVASLEETRRECEASAHSPELKITCLSADNGVEKSAVLVAEKIREEHNGQLHLLMNNAGVLLEDATAFANIPDMNVANMEVPIQTNLLGRFYMIKHLLPLLLATKGATRSIINISSIGSHVNGPLGYSLSALATNRLSQRVADAYGDQGIFCCALHPGAVAHEVMPPGAERMRDFSTDDPALCGAVSLWLVREHRGWLNGRYVDATWDVDELEKRKAEIVERDLLKMRLAV